MGNVLFLTHRLPYPPNKGDKVRAYHLLRYLAARHRVFLGTFIDDPADRAFVETVREWCAGLHVAALRPALAKLASLSGLVSGEALTLPYYRDAGLRAWVRSVCATHRIDAAMFFSSAMAQYADEIPRAPRLLEFVDVDSAKWTQYAEHHRWPMSWVYRREGARLLDFERRAAAGATRTFFVTDKEAELFRRLAPECAGRVGVVCNGVDAEYFSPRHAAASPYAPGECAVVFTGAMDYWPNIDAVVWFASEVLPRLRERWPEVRFHVVGRAPAREVQALASAAVSVSGTVPDVRPYLQHAALVVAPLRLARGIQNKILEAMAMQRPVVAAGACVRALDAAAGRDLIAADSADDYVREIAGLIDDPERARSIGAAARALVLERYSWDAHLGGFDAYLEGGRATAGAPGLAA